jgi:hypothetical protein
MSTDFKVQRVRFVSGSDTFVMRTVDADDPGSVGITSPAGSIARANDGTLWRNSDGAATWELLGDSTALSGTINARFVDLSGSVDAAFVALSGTIDARFASFVSNTTGTLSIFSGSSAATNMQTEGNIDWLVLTTYLNPPRASAANAIHSKRGGGWMRRSFDWNWAGNSFTTDGAAQGSAATTVAEDTTANSVLAGSTNKARMFSLSSPTNGWGYTFKVPATTDTRVLRVIHHQYSDVTVVSASLTDNSAPPVSVVHSTGASIGSNTSTTIVFNSSVPCELVLSFTVVARYTSDPNCGFGWATLSGNL